MKRLNETVSRQLQKFTSEVTAVGNHNVVDLSNEDEVIKAFRTIQRYIFGLLREANSRNTDEDRKKVLFGTISKGKKELRELKPFIKPETVYELEMSFRNLGDDPKRLSEHKECCKMDKKLENGFEDAIDELVGLSGAYEVSDEPMKIYCDIFADVAADLCKDESEEDCEDGEMSDAMGMELKGNDEEELDEAIRDFLPRAGAIRDEDGGKMGGFVGQGTDDQMKKAKALARARFQYLGDRFGRVSKKDVDNFEEAFYEITGRYPTEEDLYESIEVQPDMLVSDFDRAYIDGKETVEFRELQQIMDKIAPNFDFVGETSNNGYTYFRFVNERPIKSKVFKDMREELKDRLKERYGNDAILVRSGMNGYGKAMFEIRVVVDDELYDVNDEEELAEQAQPKSYLKPLNEAEEDENEMAEFDAEADSDENPVDEIRMDVPLFMRCLEFAREDAQDDMDLHHLVEKAVELSKGGEALTMEAYADLIGEEQADEAPVDTKPIDEACKTQLKESCPVRRKWKPIPKNGK